MKRITLDTNILISGTFWTGVSFKILERIDQKHDISILSKDIISEYERILQTEEIVKKVENKHLIFSRVVQKVVLNSKIVIPKVKLNVVKDDPDDNCILECAKEGNVDYIITNDRHLLHIKEFEGILIVTPETFLSIVERG